MVEKKVVQNFIAFCRRRPAQDDPVFANLHAHRGPAAVGHQVMGNDQLVAIMLVNPVAAGAPDKIVVQ